MRKSPDKAKALILGLVCLFALGSLFAPHVGQLYALWMDKVDTSYSHGILIPFVVAYLIWDKRKELLHCEAVPSWTGAAALLTSAIIWGFAVGGRSRWAIEMGMVFLVISLVWLNYGDGITRKLLFPLLLLFMMVPLPVSVYGKLSFKLQILSSRMAVGFMQAFQVPVYREGNVIHLPSNSLEVAQACSGISSVISLFTLALIFGYVTDKSFWKRLVIVFSSLPIAVFMNWLRIAATGTLTYYWSDAIAQGFYHSFSGWLVFVVAFVMLLFLKKVIDGVERMLG